jgi:hypothetical protein
MVVHRGVISFGGQAAHEHTPRSFVPGHKRLVSAGAVDLKSHRPARHVLEQALPDLHHDIDIVDGVVNREHHRRLAVTLPDSEMAVQVHLGPESEQPAALLQIKNVRASFVYPHIRNCGAPREPRDRGEGPVAPRVPAGMSGGGHRAAVRGPEVSVGENDCRARGG